MKKLLLASTALAGLALLVQPARADLKLDLDGYFRGYAVYTDNDTPGTVGGAANNKLAKFSFMRDDEVHFTGQTTLDNGLTVGVHDEIKLGNDSVPGGSTALGSQKVDLMNGPGDDATMTDETYAYFQGNWGRINLGSEDGAAYLLQVAAPSADSNIDGMRPYIQGFDTATWFGKKAGNTGTTNTASFLNITLGYDNAEFRQSERMTYLTPKWNGLQAGVSYAAVPGMQNPFGGTYGQPLDGNTGSFTGISVYKDLWELAGRWDGAFSGVGVSLGGGFSGATALAKTNGPSNPGTKNLQTWDAGLNLTWQKFSLGGAYKWSNTGTVPALGSNADAQIWDGGLGWDNGPWHAGASYYRARLGANAYGSFAQTYDVTNGQHLTLQRWTAGGGYTYGPGMTLRGAVAELNADAGTTTTHHPDQTQVTLGTDINF